MNLLDFAYFFSCNNTGYIGLSCLNYFDKVFISLFISRSYSLITINDPSKLGMEVEWHSEEIMPVFMFVCIFNLFLHSQQQKRGHLKSLESKFQFVCLLFSYLHSNYELCFCEKVTLSNNSKLIKIWSIKINFIG